MDEKTIKEALRKGERVTLECKRAKAEVPKSVWATYSASANFHVDARTIRRDMSTLQAKGIIRRNGPDKGGRWIIDIAGI